ncbi:NK-tumor recognition protein-like isoform X3 [Bombus pascuorum]|uniref:NK-tumor recognition protein-like isoform X3 n=1 Tax=Bombus pascuorum TaxID=65598 RepID=UPI00298E7390|nr:NK-tumor recognition protein-like isoform X3 [Bombus pascuorum]
METGFLNFHDEEQFSDFSLSLEQNLMEKPQDLLIHMVENDFDYMETHLDITNSANVWKKEHEHNESVDEMSDSEISTFSKIDSIKEDFAKVLTDWQEHIGYLQASDMDEYMDIIGLSMNGTDKKNFCTAENIIQDEQAIHSLESNLLIMKQEELGNESCLSSSQEYMTEGNLYYKIDDFMESDNNKIEIETKSSLIEPKHSKSQNKSKKKIHKYDSIGKDISANLFLKQKKKRERKCSQHNEDIQNGGQDNNKTTNQLPVLEAGDVKSLLEQFEASESTLVSTYSSAGTNAEYETDSFMKSNEIQQCIKQPQISNLHKDIRDALPKEVIEKIKTSARKKMISVIPAMSSNQNNGHSNGTRMQDAAASLFRNKLLKIVTNNTKSKTIDGGLVQLDHDYCSMNSCIKGLDNNTYEKESFSSDLNKSFMKNTEYSTDSNSKKDSGLESGEVSDNNEEQSGVTTVRDIQDNKPIKQLQNETKICRKETLASKGNCQQINISSNTTSCVISQNESASTSNAIPQMKIHSALAANILQIRQGVLSKTKSIKAGSQRTKQMVSVLKKPLNVQVPIVKTISNENIVTTTNSLHDKVQNIIVQDSEKTFTKEEEKKPPRKKLNLAEYRSRREQNRSDNSRTNSPLQPMTLVYIHHASTTTEPIKDDPKNLIWSEREIVSVLKPKLDVEEKTVRPKPLTYDIGIQTYETVFEFPPKSLIDVDERHKQRRDNNVRDKNQRSNKKHGIGSNSNRSKSRSKSKSKSRSRSRSSSNRSSSNRSRSHKRSNTRHRRISHRRSSVSSSSSWSSRSHSRSRSCSSSRSRSRPRSRSRSRSHFRCRSRSDTRSSFSSESRYSRSRSRSTRSRSQSSSRYSSCSRSSSRSNFGRIKWSKRRRRRDRRHYISYDRHRQHSAGSYHSYRDWRRSPPTSYRRSYDNWYDREKQKQVEERRVIYVGRLDEAITKADLRRRFETFGPVVDISIHFREHGDNYGFVTFAYKNDAYEAVEHGNDDPTLPRYDLCFGGRRAFCKVKYADLDGMASSSLNSGHMLQNSEDNTFDLLLKEAKAKLRKRKV